MRPSRFVTLLVLSLGASLRAQTFNGAISGAVVDSSNAAIANVAVQAVHKDTGIAFNTLSGESGDFLFPNLPLGEYSLTFTKELFQVQRMGKVEVAVARITNVQAKLGIAQQSTLVEVVASAAALETTSSTLGTVVGRRQVQDMPLNGRNYQQMLRLSPGASPAGPQQQHSVNGSRNINNNFQIDGVDNNDAFFNSPAGGTGGGNGLLPLDAIDQLSVVTNASADFGRNSGSNVSVVVRSGANQLHGSAYYFNRNEYFTAYTPFQDPSNSKKRALRTGQWGFSAGGAVVKNKLFYFAAAERFHSILGLSFRATHPSTAWVNGARGVLQKFGIPVNPVAINLLSLWPERYNNLPAVLNNFVADDRNTYDSYNGILKLDYAISSKHNVSARYFGSTATNQTQSPLVGAVPYREYFPVVDTRPHSVGVNLNSTLSPRLVNQLLLGANYYLLSFHDFDSRFDPIAAGLNTGVPQDGTLRGSPTLRIANFAGTGLQSPTGRIDTTGHVTNNLSYVSGRHAWKFGGEYRRAHFDVFFHTNKRGIFNWDGTRGPWAADAAVSAPLRALSDFLAGTPTNNNGATIVRGELQRDYRQNLADWWVHDNWQVNPKLNLNFGVRWSYLGPLSDTRGSISSFSLDKGFEKVGKDGVDLWAKDWNNFAPRVGFAYRAASKTAIRGGYGIFYDVPAINSFVANLNMPNGGAAGIHANPTGSDPVFTITASGVNIVPGQPVFPANVTLRNVGAIGVSKDFRMSYVHNFNLNVQHQLNAKTVAQIGYVGSHGTALPLLRSVNPVVNGRRLHIDRYPALAAINIQESIGNSNYNSLQASIRTTRWNNVTLNASYTAAKALDNGSGVRDTIAANSFDLRREYGPGAFDIRHVFTGFAIYDVPALGSRLPRLTRGWQLNSLFSVHTGEPIDLLSGTNRSGTFDTRDRVDVVGDWKSAVPARANPFAAVPWFNPRAFAAAATGTFGNIVRNALRGPGFGSVDFSIFKETPITERIRTQLRVEIFNVFNRVNFANPGNNLNAPASFGLSTNTRNAAAASGIGFGEPRNVQLALKLIW
jgi:hypothetical protein